MLLYSKNLLDVFASISSGAGSIDEVAKVTRLSPRTIYRLTDELIREGLVKKEDGSSGRFRIENDLRAMALREYLNSGTHPGDSIIGSKMLIILSLSEGNKTIERIATETRLTVETVKVLIWRLQGYGMLFKKGNLFCISPSDDDLIMFALDMSRGVCHHEMQDQCQNGKMIWSRGLQFVFETDDINEGTSSVPTGISAAGGFGVMFIAKTGYYHWAYWHPQLRKEDIALHILMTGPRSARTIGHCMLFLKSTCYDKVYLRSEANLLGMTKLVGDVISALDGKEIKNKFIPKKEEMSELYKDYGLVC